MSRPLREDFLHLILQHVLPKGFRRVRVYGFLHGNAKKLLSLVQLILHVVIEEIKQRPRPVFKCPRCQSPISVNLYGNQDSSFLWQRLAIHSKQEEKTFMK